MVNVDYGVVFCIMLQALYNLFLCYFCRYVVFGGLPTVVVLVRGSDFAADFLSKFSVK